MFANIKKATSGDRRASAPERKRQIPYDTRGIEADAYFTQPLGDPSPTLEAFKEVLHESVTQMTE